MVGVRDAGAQRRGVAAHRQAAAVEQTPQLAAARQEVLLLEAVQTAKYPDTRRTKPSLDKFQQLDALKEKLQG